MTVDIKLVQEQLEAVREYVICTRRRFHENPSPSGKEEQAALLSRHRLRSWACRTAVMPTTGCWFGWRGRVRGRRFACGQTTTR